MRVRVRAKARQRWETTRRVPGVHELWKGKGRRQKVDGGEEG